MLPFEYGFYIVTYGLGIYLPNLLIGFLSPKVDPELEVMDGPSLPTKGSDEFKPFIRRLPKFKFWWGAWSNNPNPCLFVPTADGLRLRISSIGQS